MSATHSDIRSGSIAVSVSDEGNPVEGARVSVYFDPLVTCLDFNPDTWRPSRDAVVYDVKPTDAEGRVLFHNVPPGVYVVTYGQHPVIDPKCITVESGCIGDVCFNLGLKASAHMNFFNDDCQPIPCPRPRVGDRAEVRIQFGCAKEKWDQLSMAVATPGYSPNPGDDFSFSGVVTQPGPQSVDVSVVLPGHTRAAAGGAAPSPASATPAARLHLSVSLDALEQSIGPTITGNVGVTLRRSQTHPTDSQALWVAIRNRTKAISFGAGGYKDFIDRVLCLREELPPDKQGVTLLNRQLEELGDHVYGTKAYELLKTATEVFLLLECGVAIKDRTLFNVNEEAGRLGQVRSFNDLNTMLGQYLGQDRLPYINRVVKAAFPGDVVGLVHCEGVLTSRVNVPCLLELIWNYWNEEGMLVQSINAVSQRFQNVRAPGERDPLAHLEIDPLRPLNNILWGYVEDERNRLSVRRRALEYRHQYGLNLYGKAVSEARPADSRSKFVEAFHNLLHLSADFFRADSDTTIIADGYPLLNALKEVHLILAFGAHNQFGDLPWTARVEMLIKQWLMARREMRDFLQSRAMVPYKEAWMPQVDTMKTLQGWTDVTITHFNELATFGEQIVLSIRYHDWIDINDEDEAKNWARYFRPELQGYLHAYRAVTGVDLTNPDVVDYTMPSAHLRRRLAMQQRAR